MTKISFEKQIDYNVKTLKKTMEKTFENLGISNGFIKNGERVLIKPNMAYGKHYSKCICTHPAVIRVVYELISDMGGKCFIGDSPGLGKFIDSAKKSGYMEFLQGFEMQDFLEKVEVKNLDNKIFKTFKVARQITETDKIINIAKFKTHGSMLLTLSVKNMFGAIVGLEKPEHHLRAGKNQLMFAKYLVELYYTIKPDLNVVDAIQGMQGNGPVAGEPKDMGFISAGFDGIILDYYTAKTTGFPANTLPTFIAAKQLGHGITDIEKAHLVGTVYNGIQINDFKYIIEPDMKRTGLINFLGSRLPIRPKINNQKCVMCGICKNICPAKTISIIQNKMVINYKKCINCFCCQEFCEHDAIRPVKPLLRKITSGISRAFSIFKLKKRKNNVA